MYGLWVAIVIAGGVALRWNAVDGSLFADDWDQYAMQAGIYPVTRGPLDLFNFVGVSAAEHRALLRSGRLPWWSAPDLQLAVFRPLSSALVHLDYSLLHAAEHPYRAHLHSMLWWVALVCAVAALLGRLLPLPLAAVAVLLYALDEAHSLLVAWSANRSALVAVGLVLWGLWAHVLAAARGKLRWRAASLVLVGLGLLAGEHALAPLAYFVALELFAASGSIRSRLRALVPVAALTGIYLIVRARLGYGVAASGFYIDPWAQPWRFVLACMSRMLLLLGDLVFGYAAEWAYWEPPWRSWWLEQPGIPSGWLSLTHLQHLQRTAGVLALLGVLFLVAAWSRAQRNESQRTLRWLLVGAVLSLVPVCGTLPMSRLTVAAAVGFDAALAWFLWILFERVRSHAGLLSRASGFFVASLIIAVHLVFASSRGRNEVSLFAMRSHLEESWVLGAELEPAGLAQRHIMLICSRDMASQWALSFIRHRHGLAMPESSQLLSAAFDRPHRLVRVAARVLDLELRRPVANEPTFAFSAYRPDRSPFRAGDSFDGANFQVLILAAEAGEPTRLRFIFQAPLEDESYTFLYARPSRLERVNLPAVGQSLELAPPSWPGLAPR